MVVVPVGKMKVSQPFGFDAHGTLGIPVRLIVTAEQLSSAVATPSSSSSNAEQEAVIVDTGPGTWSVGGAVSPDDVTTIACVQDAMRPPSSVAVQVMTVVPAGNGSVKSWVSLRRLVIVTLLPVAVGDPMSPAVSVISQLSALKLLLEGQEIVGASADVT